MDRRQDVNPKEGSEQDRKIQVHRQEQEGGTKRSASAEAVSLKARISPRLVPESLKAIATVTEGLPGRGGRGAPNPPNLPPP